MPRTGELLGIKPPRVEPGEDTESKRLWKRFQMVAVLPEKDRRAVIGLMNSLAAIAAPRKNGTQGERHGR